MEKPDRRRTNSFNIRGGNVNPKIIIACILGFVWLVSVVLTFLALEKEYHGE